MKIQSFLEEVYRMIIGVDSMELAKAVNLLRVAKAERAMVWLAGNGGSASTASHFANDLVKQCGIKAIALPDLVSLTTAYGNDYGWASMFSNPLDVFQPTPLDVLVLFSCSGMSSNITIFNSVWKGGPVIIFTGDNQDSVLVQSTRAEAIIQVFNSDIMIQESIHLAACHAIIDSLKGIKPEQSGLADAVAYAMRKSKKRGKDVGT